MYVKITKIMPLNQRQYVDKSGEQQLWKSKGFLLSNGLNEIYAEASGGYAEKLEQRQFDPTQHYVADLRFRVSEYTDKDGNVRYRNDVELTRLNVL